MMIAVDNRLLRDEVGVEKGNLRWSRIAREALTLIWPRLLYNSRPARVSDSASTCDRLHIDVG